MFNHYVIQALVSHAIPCYTIAYLINRSTVFRTLLALRFLIIIYLCLSLHLMVSMSVGGAPRRAVCIPLLESRTSNSLSSCPLLRIFISPDSFGIALSNKTRTRAFPVTVVQRVNINGIKCKTLSGTKRIESSMISCSDVILSIVSRYYEFCVFDQARDHRLTSSADICRVSFIPDQ